MEKDWKGKQFPPFYPTFDGCVTGDIRFAGALEERYMEELGAVSAYTYRAMVWKRWDARISALFEQLAKEEMLHFRILGELILALGGNPVVQAKLCVPAIDLCGRGGRGIFAESIREERRGIDGYQTLMGKTQDRVVRSVLSHLVADEHRHIEVLCGEQGGIINRK